MTRWRYCPHNGAGEPYLPLLEALGRLGRGPQGARLVKVLRQQAPSWLVHLPALVTPEESATLQLRVGSASRERMLREFAEAIETLTSVSPLILLLEDLHWSDVSTVEWLAYVARRRDPARLLVLGTCRSGEAMLHHHPVRTVTQELQRQGQGGQLALGYLTEVSVNAYLLQRFGNTSMTTQLSHLLHYRTNGNPLFLVTLVDDMVRQGELADLKVPRRYSGGTEAVVRGVPESLRDMIERQLEQLASQDQILLEAACVAGVAFAAASVAAAVDDDVEAVEARCDALARQGLFVQSRDATVWPDGTIAAQYGFRHALYQEVLYERVPVSRRVRWHGQIGARLELGHGVQRCQIAAELAEHFVRAQDVPRAVMYLRQAAENAMRRYAVEEALEHYTQALEMVVAAGIGTGDGLVSDLHLQRGRLYAQTGTIAHALEDFEAALKIARAVGNQDSEIQALYALGSYGWATDYQEAIQLFEAALPLAQALDDVTSQVRLLSRMSVLYTNRLQLAQAFDYGHRALALARDLEDERTLALAMDSIEVAAAFVGDFTTLDELAPQLVTLHRRHGDLWYLQFALYQGSYVAIGAGRWDDALAQLEEVLAINRRVGDRGSEPIYVSTQGWVHRSRGAYQAAVHHGRLAVNQSEELGDTGSMAWSAACLGWTLLEVYALEEAVCYLKQGLQAAEAAMVLSHVLRCAGPLAWASWLLGDAEGAQALAARAETLCQQLTAPPGRAFVQGVHAYVAITRVYLALGEARHAYQCLTPLLKAAETCGWQEAIAYGSLVVGQSLMACGAGRRAEAALLRSLQVTRDIGLPAVAWKTHAALACYYRNYDRLDVAAHHHVHAQTIIEQLAGTLDDAAMRQGFLHTARRQLNIGV